MKMICVRHSLRRFIRNDRGTQLIELAIVLPVMLILLSGIAEFGRYFYTYTTLSKAARAGARYMSTKSYVNTEKAKAENYVVYGKISPGAGDKPVISGFTVDNVDITTPDGFANATDPVTIRVSIDYNYTPIFNLGGLIGFNWVSVPVRPTMTIRYLVV